MQAVGKAGYEAMGLPSSVKTTGLPLLLPIGMSRNQGRGSELH